MNQQPISMKDLPSLTTDRLVELAEAYEAAVKQYHTQHMKQSCRNMANHLRGLVAVR
jgi:hypothetical protein